MAGLGAGVTEAILVNPFEVVKVTLQSNKTLAAQMPSTWAVTKEIVRTQGFGFKGLNKGVTATIARNGSFNMVYFGFYHSVKGLLPEYDVKMSNNNILFNLVSLKKSLKILISGSFERIFTKSFNRFCLWNACFDVKYTI